MRPVNGTDRASRTPSCFIMLATWRPVLARTINSPSKNRPPSGQHNEAGRGPRRPVSTIDWRHSLLGLWKKAVGIESDREHGNAVAQYSRYLPYSSTC